VGWKWNVQQSCSTWEARSCTRRAPTTFKRNDMENFHHFCFLNLNVLLISELIEKILNCFHKWGKSWSKLNLNEPLWIHWFSILNLFKLDQSNSVWLKFNEVLVREIPIHNSHQLQISLSFYSWHIWTWKIMINCFTFWIAFNVSTVWNGNRYGSLLRSHWVKSEQIWKNRFDFDIDFI
jgi:hypothetical protein